MSSVSWVPRIGAEFAGYRLLSLVGYGGMSIVYRAEHIGLGRVVALKLLSPELSDDVDFQERFQRESRMAAALEHPNIIPIYEAGDESGVYYIAMRFVEGADLKTLLKREGPLDPERVVSVVSQVAAALEAAHERDLIHRDVKPANILIAAGAGPDRSDHVYLADFGVAKNTQSAGLTRTGLFVGTADYADGQKLLPCESGAPGSKTWVHPTGKVGGHRFCFQDANGNFVVAWTHEKRGSEDHVDMLATAREPGRAPTTFQGWWNSVNDFIGKCRPLIGEEACFATIQRITGQR